MKILRHRDEKIATTRCGKFTLLQELVGKFRFFTTNVSQTKKTTFEFINDGQVTLFRHVEFPLFYMPIFINVYFPDLSFLVNPHYRSKSPKSLFGKIYIETYLNKLSYFASIL